MKKLFTLSAVLLMFSICVNAQNENMEKKLKGTWNYTCKEAPYQYQKGKAIFYEEDKEFKVKIGIDGYAYHGRDLKITEQDVEFIVYVENELVALKLTLNDNKMKGTAKTYEADLAITLEKEKS